jgi:hypothetical protein
LRPHQIVLFVLFEEEEDGDSQDDGESQGEDEGHRRTKKRKTDSKRQGADVTPETSLIPWEALYAQALVSIKLHN